MPETVGDAIISARQVIPDMPQTLGVPNLVSVAAATVIGGQLTAGTYYVKITAKTPYGESLPSNEQTVTLSGGQNSIIVNQSPANVGIPTDFNVYIGTTAGLQVIWAAAGNTTASFTISAFPNSGAPPSRNTAFLPDTDGALVGASAIYGWLRDGLRIISRLAGGLLDYSGIQSAINQPLYQLNQTWIEITSLWYDGWWFKGGDRGQFFRRNTLTSSILSGASISAYNNVQVLELYPQPSRTAASTTLAVAMAATDLTATLASTSGYLLPFGFTQIGSELMAYNVIRPGNQLVGLIRGLGGSFAVPHLVGETALEINCFWSGKRQIDPNYQPGSSASVLPIPNGWGVLLAQYISGRAKNIEHDGQYSKQLADDLKASIKEWGRNEKGVVRRRQVGGDGAPAAYYSDMAGGIIIN